MNKLIAITLLLSAINAQALDCQLPTECMSQSISLIRKVTKANVKAGTKLCESEVKALASSAMSKALTRLDPTILALEDCAAKGKYQIKLAKQQAKLQERMAKALKGE